MLRNLNQLLTGSVLKCLDEMGHAETLALVDRNFPAYRYGRPVLSMMGSDTEAVAEALFSVFPVDSFVDVPIMRMQIDGQPDVVTDAHAIAQKIASKYEGRQVNMGSYERQEFYERATQATVFIHTGETVGYSCFLIQKGVI